VRFPVPYYPSPLELLPIFSAWHEARTTRRSLLAVVQMIRFRSSWSGYISDGKGSNYSISSISHETFGDGGLWQRTSPFASSFIMSSVRKPGSRITHTYCTTYYMHSSDYVLSCWGKGPLNLARRCQKWFQQQDYMKSIEPGEAEVHRCNHAWHCNDLLRCAADNDCYSHVNHCHSFEKVS
jgi:hypothetical protein